MFELDEYVIANSLNEVVSIMKERKGTARVISGGTLVHEFAARGMLSNVKILVDLGKLGLSYIKEENGKIRIGAMTTHAQLHEYFKDSPKYRALGEASKLIAQVRNVATIGGSVCAGMPWFELPVALLAYDTKLAVKGVAGERLIDLSEFYLDYLFTTLEPTEFLVEIQIPKAIDGTVSKYISHRTTTVGVPVGSVAVKVVKNSENLCTESRIAVGSAGRIVMRAKEAEKCLIGKALSPRLPDEGARSVMTKEEHERLQERPPTPSDLKDVFEAVLSNIKPISDTLATESFRKYICGVLLQKALEVL
jgi:carbon-monoxide dehydrogenase medium subunit